MRVPSSFQKGFMKAERGIGADFNSMACAFDIAGICSVFDERPRDTLAQRMYLIVGHWILSPSSQQSSSASIISFSEVHISVMVNPSLVAMTKPKQERRLLPSVPLAPSHAPKSGKSHQKRQGRECGWQTEPCKNGVRVGARFGVCAEITNENRGSRNKHADSGHAPRQI